MAEKFTSLFLGFDGTLINSLYSICSALNLTFEKYGLKRMPDDEIFQLAAYSNEIFVEKCLEILEKRLPLKKKQDKTEKDVFVKEFSANFESLCFDQVMMFPGFAFLLENLMLKDVKLAVFSSKPEQITRRILAYFDADEFFDGFFFTGQKDCRICLPPAFEVEKTLFAGCFDWEFELMKKNGFAVCKVKNPLMDEFFPSRFKCDFYAEKPADLLSFF